MLYSVKERRGFIEGKVGVYEVDIYKKLNVSHPDSIVVSVYFRGILSVYPYLIVASVPVSDENIDLDNLAYYIFSQIHTRIIQGHFVSEKELEETIKAALEVSKS